MRRTKGKGLNYFDSLITAKPIQLVEELQHSPLNLSVTALLRIKALGANSIQFVDENDRRRLLFRKSERVSHKFSSVSDEHLHQRRSREFQVTGFRLSGASTSEKSFARSLDIH